MEIDFDIFDNEYLTGALWYIEECITDTLEYIYVLKNVVGLSIPQIQHYLYAYAGYDQYEIEDYLEEYRCLY